MLEGKSSLNNRDLEQVSGGFVPEYEEPDNLELESPFPSENPEIITPVGKEDTPYRKSFN